MRANYILLVSLMLSGSTAYTQILHIPEDYPSIQSGIDSAGNGDTILVAEGRYYENINLKGKAITVASRFILDRDTSYITGTIIDGSRSSNPDTSSTILLVSGEDSTTVICGFTITGGTGTKTRIDYPHCRAGGGIFIFQSSGKIVNNIITQNHIQGERQILYGGGMYASLLNTNSSLIITNNIIKDNSINSSYMVDGAGISTVLGDSGSILIQGNFISQNIARSTGTYYAHGGGLTLITKIPSQSKFEVSGNTIAENELSGMDKPRPSTFKGFEGRHTEYGANIILYGAGIYVLMFREAGYFVDLNPIPVIRDNIISGNYSEYGGGGMAIVAATDQSSNSLISPRPILINNLITDNHAQDGAGIFVSSASPMLVNNVFRNDLSSQGCGEILSLGASEVFTCNNEFQDNFAGKKLFKLFGRYYLKFENKFFKTAVTLRDGSIMTVNIPPPWRTWWAFTGYGVILISFLLWYRRFILNRAALRTALEIEKIEKEKVQEIDRMKSRFFENISHEFRTPLTLLLGPINDLLNSKPGKEKIDWDLIRMMQRNTTRLQSLINQLLELAKLETGKVKLQAGEGDLTEFVRRIILSFLSLSESKDIRYEYQLPEYPTEVYFDGDKVEKILTNLLSNAFKFTSEGGMIKISMKYLSPNVKKTKQEVEFTVRDSGKGIPEDEIDNVFDRFYQVNTSEIRDKDGSGIGLSLTKELVELYRGTIKAESKPGSGSIFTVRLPVSREQFMENEIVEIPLTESTSQTGLSTDEESRESLEENDSSIVLVVEDHADLRKYIVKNLDSSYRILQAENGNEGLDKAFEFIPDIVISDLMMPGMDGMDMCQRMKADQRTDHIPVIMLTARADRQSKLDGLETGADDYIIKPFDAEELRLRVNNLIRQRLTLRAKYRRQFLTGGSDIGIKPAHEEFLGRLSDSIQANYQDPQFNVESLCRELGMSRSQLYRKVLATTGFTPTEYLRNIRLKKAAQLFREEHHNIAQVAYSVGFNNPSYFSECFRDLHGSTPSDFIREP
ncbi:ATP-binding protein [Bacteroidota bacterium]